MQSLGHARQPGRGRVPALTAGAGQVVIDVKAAGVNFPDVLIIQGKYQFKPALPFTPGSELAGVVRGGRRRHHVKVGDQVIAFVAQARSPSRRWRRRRP